MSKMVYVIQVDIDTCRKRQFYNISSTGPSCTTFSPL